VSHAGRPAASGFGATVAIVAAQAEAARKRCDAGADRARIPVAPDPFGFVLDATCRDLR
jgi:hypothetical protein